MALDYEALPALHETMEAAGFHDLDRALAALDHAEAALPDRFHQSRTAIQQSRESATAGAWADCWAAAYRAMQTLTGPFPPDISKCALRPDDARPHVRDAACGCGAVLPPGVTFCPTCGARAA